jgi:hypothetical protein
MSDGKRWLYVLESVAGLTIVVFIGSAFYKLLSWQHVEHSALVFIGVPAVLAVAAVLLPRPGSAKGAIVRATTVALLLSSVLFGEGFVCIVMAAPLFYGVGLVIGLIIDKVSGESDEPPRVLSCVLVLVFLPLSLEGVVPGLELARNTSVTVEQVVDGSPAQVEAALMRTPRFERTLPAFFRHLHFPTPGATSGEGLSVGDKRTIEFLHGAGNAGNADHGAGHHPGVLTMEVREREAGRVLFAMHDDTSYITHWLSWHYAEVTWHEVAPGRTRVSWTLAYRRRLDPAWYFAPLERYGVGLAAGYLIEALATPRDIDVSAIAGGTGLSSPAAALPQAQGQTPPPTPDTSAHGAHAAVAEALGAAGAEGAARAAGAQR